MLYEKKPNYTGFKTFSCASFPCLKPYNQNKFQFHNVKCVFLGYHGSHNGYKCLSSTRRVYISRYVIFNEAEFPFSAGFINLKQPQKNEALTSSSPFPTQVEAFSTVSPTIQSTRECSNQTQGFPTINQVQSPKQMSHHLNLILFLL